VLENPLRQWLSLRIRILCVCAFVVGSLLPPYIPREAQAVGGDEGMGAVTTQQFMLVEDGFLMKSSSLTQQGSRLAYGQGIVHVVRDNDNLQKIAQRYGIKLETLLWANNLTPDAKIHPGQELLILPVDGVLHTVGRGQTLQQISEIYGVSPQEISRQNGIQGGFILAGQQLIIPGGKPILIAGKPQPLSFKPRLPGGFPGLQQPNAPANVQAAVPSFGVLQMPCNDCSYTQFFHPGHYAVDIQTRGGGPVFAAADGTVIRADIGWDGGYGNVIEIDHGNGLVTLYGHNKELYVKKGDHVTRGQMISWMGNTGRVYGPTGIHVHFEVRVNGEKKNPLLYLK
jgi:LysM repeat protein